MTDLQALPVLVTCKGCGESFSPQRRRAEFCSRPCYSQFYYRSKIAAARTPTTATCEECGVESPARWKNRRYCSSKCRSAADYRRQKESGLRRRKDPVEQTCAACGSKFRSVRLRRCCTKSCYELWRRIEGPNPCAIDGCGMGVVARGLCSSHYRRQMFECTVCGNAVERTMRRNGERPTCSFRCRAYLQHGDPRDRYPLVGPVERRPIARKEPKPAKPKPVKVRFVAVNCRWCGDQFLHDRQVTGEQSVWCSKQCGRKAGKAKRRAQAANAGGTYTWSEVVRLYLKLGGCAYCGVRLPVADIEPDHVVPLSRGGSNSITNIVPACRTCNRDKSARLLPEWYQARAERGLEPVLLDPRVRHLTSIAA